MPECKMSKPGIENFQPVPEWVCADYVEKVLQKHHGNSQIKIVDISINPATAKGENYASVMSRVKVRYSEPNKSQLQSGSYLIKSTFEGDKFATETLAHYDVYEREMEIYSKIFPKLKEILLIEGFNEDLVPGTIKIDKEHTSIVFEDLSNRAFVTPDRLKGFDMIHAKMVLRKLAKLQAASAVLGDIAPETFRLYDRGMFNRHTDVYTPFYVNSLLACAEAASKLPGCEQYAQKMFRLKDMVMEYGKRAFDCKDNHINVLVHGDLWVTNAMFKYNSKQEPVDNLIIDFQYSFWSSPTVDLHYFFNTSLNEELIISAQDELVQYYYEILSHTLKNLKFKGYIPTLKEFWKEFMETSFYAFISGCLIRPYQINENTADADIAALMKSDARAENFKKIVFGSERVHRLLQRLLPIFDRKGLLESQQ